MNEWPGRELGVFVSIGTGKRPPGTSNRQHEWWEGFVGGGLGDLAEARRRLISKIEGCEQTHQYMTSEYLQKRGVDPSNYYRLNVEVGVGEFGMNEWHRLADISTSTRRYLAKHEVKKTNEEAAAKLGRIERSKRRHANFTSEEQSTSSRQPQLQKIAPPLNPMAVELPGDDRVTSQGPQGPQGPTMSPRYGQVSSADDKFVVLAPDDIPMSAGGPHFRRSADMPRRDNDRLSNSSMVPSPRRSHESYRQTEAPPLPPKTPLVGGRPPPPFNIPPRSNGHVPIKLPYPDDDGPPPVVNMAGKPEFIPR